MTAHSFDESVTLGASPPPRSRTSALPGALTSIPSLSSFNVFQATGLGGAAAAGAAPWSPPASCFLQALTPTIAAAIATTVIPARVPGIPWRIMYLLSSNVVMVNYSNDAGAAPKSRVSSRSWSEIVDVDPGDPDSILRGSVASPNQIGDVVDGRGGRGGGTGVGGAAVGGGGFGRHRERLDRLGDFVLGAGVAVDESQRAGAVLAIVVVAGQDPGVAEAGEVVERLRNDVVKDDRVIVQVDPSDVAVEVELEPLRRGAVEEADPVDGAAPDHPRVAAVGGRRPELGVRRSVGNG